MDPFSSRSTGVISACEVRDDPCSAEETLEQARRVYDALDALKDIVQEGLDGEKSN